VFNRLALLGYSDREEIENPRLFLLFADTPKSLKKVEMPFTIEKETWVFISYAFDYANDTTQLYVNY